MKTRETFADASQRGPVAAEANHTRAAADAGAASHAFAQGSALAIDVGHSPRMLAQRRAINSVYGDAGPHAPRATRPLSASSTAPAQRTEMDAITLANQLSTVGQFSSWQEVHGHKDSFDAEAWRSIVGAYNRGNGSGVRLRYTPPKPKLVPVPEKASSTPSPTDRLKTAGSIAGTLGTVVSGAQTIHETGLGDALQHAPVFGAISSAATAVTKSERADEAYLRGDLATSAMHRVGSVASGVKAASDSLTVGSFGLSAPVTVPVSMVASGINTVTSLPDYASTAKSALSDPRRTVAKGMISAASVPETISSAYDSVTSTLGGLLRSGTDRLGLTTPEEDRPPPTAEELRATREQEARRKQEKAAAKAQRLGPAKDFEGTRK